VSRWLRWLIPILLASGALAGGIAAWHLETATPDASAAGSGGAPTLTPVLSVRRLPTVVAAPIAARRLATDLDALMAFMPADSCAVVEGREVAYDHRGEVPVVPASTAKLLTATAALEALAPTARFRTSVVTARAPVDGVVSGDLTVVGGGDALLASADYAGRFMRQPQVFSDIDALAAAVEEAGVRRIDGAVVGDDGRYDRARYVAGWPVRYIAQGSVGPLSALSVNDGFERYPRSPAGGDPLEPAADPALDAAALLTSRLESRGIEVAGPPRSGVPPAGAIEVAFLESPPLPDVVGQMLRESDNNTAELLLKELGRVGGDPSTAGGAAEVGGLLDDGRLDLTGTRVVDGSGLSPDNRATCRLLVDLLDRPETGELLRELLPVAGQTGTLTERFQGTALEGVLRAKTGSLTSVTALAGVVADHDPDLTFAFVVNVPPPARVPDGIAAAQQRLGEILAAWPRTADLEALGPVVQDG
jgi:D-alanyl-D-alanine carboxypeptidase/D-alanyl-D-alanine-endopeptidase (penicillin-binding protein 4)